MLDLAVSNNTERGLLGLALHPNFAEDRGVYLFWTCRGNTPLDADPFTPEEQECSDANVLGADTNEVLAVPLLGNRVDRFEWDGSALTYESNLNDDGTTPSDNPFFAAGAAIGGEVGENVQKIFAYGVRNSFGMAFDPLSGNLWDQENGEDAYDELNLVEPGMNSGWIQFMGPALRIAEFKLIETTAPHHEDSPNLQQLRWGPERIADTPEGAFARLFVLPGSNYSDPWFSWKHVPAPAAIGFLKSSALGPRCVGDLFVGSRCRSRSAARSSTST